MFTRCRLLRSAGKAYCIINHRMHSLTHDSRHIFYKSVEAVDPNKLIKQVLKLNNNELLVCNKKYEVANNCYVVGFGKAVLRMAERVELILGSHLVTGVVSVPVGTFSSEVRRPYSTIKYIEGAKNNLPDRNARLAAWEIAELVKSLDKKDLLIVLISGGGSALLPLPKSPVTLEEKSQLIKLLSTRGADILELNCVRKRLSQLKGGGLARLAYPATVVSLILSDIIGDPLDCIASGPTTPNTDTGDKAMRIIEKFGLTTKLPHSINEALRNEDISKTLEDGSFAHVTNFVIGNNKVCAREAVAAAKGLGYQSTVISVAVNGDVSLISESYTRIALETANVMKGISSKAKLYSTLKDVQTVLKLSDETINELINYEFEALDGGICLVAAGEPTVTVTGEGRGGRNQQLALQFAIDVDNALLLHQSPESVKSMNISLLSCGTDGIDGPTDAAGAIGFSGLCALAQKQNIDPVSYLTQNDSNSFFNTFQYGKYLVDTGHTGTNVMDIHVLIIKK